MIFKTTRGEILHGAPVRGRLTVILCFFYLRMIATTVVTFSPSCLATILISLTFLNSSLVLAMVESLESDLLIDCFCGQVVFYRGNKLRLGAFPLRDTWEPEILLIDKGPKTIYNVFEMRFFFVILSHCSDKPTIKIID